jgi:hypothetical protein
MAPSFAHLLYTRSVTTAAGADHCLLESSAVNVRVTYWPCDRCPPVPPLYIRSGRAAPLLLFVEEVIAQTNTIA